jgi:hypothetical protein
MKLEAATGRLGRPDLHAEFLALLRPELPPAQAEALLARWLAAYRDGQSAADEAIHPARRTIYERGFRAQIQADRSAEALWLMLATWTALMRNVPSGHGHADAWAAFLDELGLATPEGFAARAQQAADYVTRVDGVLEGWAEQNGA